MEYLRIALPKLHICMQLLAFSLPVFPATGYFIGNSLIQGVQIDGLMLMAESREVPLTNGIHHVPGASLDYIWRNPGIYYPDSHDYGGFSNALPNNNWSFVVLQPSLSNDSGSTLELDSTHLIDFINFASSGGNTETRFYIFTSYPAVSTGDYQAAWSEAIDVSTDTKSEHARQYFEILRERITDRFGIGFPIFIIPLGEVLYEIERQIQAETIPGFTGVFSDFYRDNFHLNDAYGNWVAANTVYATVLQEDPTGITKPDPYFGSGADDLLPTGVSKALQTIVWKVVSTYPYTGVRALDSDSDGVDDISDNCPRVANEKQADFDFDLMGDACDLDDDNDGAPDLTDLFPFDPEESMDTDSDGAGNNTDNDDDDDGDGLRDGFDSFPLDASLPVQQTPETLESNVNATRGGSGMGSVVVLALILLGGTGREVRR